MSLNDLHKGQLQGFIAYFRGKRERQLHDREVDKAEFKSDRLSDDQALYNKTDVEDLVDAYHAQLIGCNRESIEETINLSAVYVSQLFAQAEQSGLILDVSDVASIDSQHGLSQLASFASTGMVPPLVKRAGTLPTLGALPQSDPAMMQKVQELEEMNRQMSDRYQLMQSEVSNLLGERSALAGELDKVKANFTQMRMDMHQQGVDSNANVNVVQIEQSLQDTQGMLVAKQHECEQMRHDLNQRLGDSVQFKELKAIVKKKSDEVKALRLHMAQSGLAPPQQDGGVELTADDD